MNIECDVPPPPKRNRFPWGTLEVGQSVFITADEYGGKHIGGVMSNAITWAKRHDPSRKFQSQKKDGGIRVWRIE